MFRKGQAAMEFLMTYGWAILVVLVAIGALAYFGVLNPGKFLPSACTIEPGIACDFKYDSTDDSVQLVLTNGMGESLSDVSVSVSTCTQDTNADGDDTFEDTSTLDITLTDCPDVSLGDRIRENVVIEYTASSGIEHKKTGTITGKSE